MTKNSWTLIVFSPKCLQALHFEILSAVRIARGDVSRTRLRLDWNTQAPWLQSPSPLRNRPLRLIENRHEIWPSSTPDGELRRKCSAVDRSDPAPPAFWPCPA